MMFLVKDILDFAQIENNSLVLNLEEVDLFGAIKECLDVLSYKAEQKGILLLMDNKMMVEGTLYLQTDRNRLKQILINLISNSVKYTQIGRVTVEVSQRDEHLYIAVIDTGMGMTPEQASKVFKPYTKIMANRNLNKEGVGLGLSASQKIAKALHGDITVTSVVNKGSIFTLKMPSRDLVIKDINR